MIMDELDGFTERIVKGIALDITANLIETTPVDLGWARANWVPVIGVRAETRAITNPEGADIDRQRGKQQAGIAQVAARYKLGAGAIHIINPVTYIVPLNEGSSKQAPAGFVQDAIRKAVTKDLKGL